MSGLAVEFAAPTVRVLGSADRALRAAERLVPMSLTSAPSVPVNPATGVSGGVADDDPLSSVEAPVSILWIDDEVAADDPLVQLLRYRGFHSDVAHSALAGIAMSAQQRYDAVLLDLRLPDMFGLTALERIVATDSGVPVIVVTGCYLDPQLKADAMRRGAAAFLYKPLDVDELAPVLRSVAGVDRRSTPAPSWRFGIVAASQAMRHVIEWIERVGPRHCGVLLTGETGTGKELVARALQLASARRTTPFVPVNCAAIPELLVESELFGHRKGAFTGAISDKHGLFHAADRGTLFLDEVGDLPAAMQARLLRCLEDGEVRRIGDTHARRVDVRVIAATNRDLRNEVARGRFREDLYYRLCVAHCHLPPLRERPEDIEPLVSHWLRSIPSNDGGQMLGISPAALRLLTAHLWPGNVRELRHVLERAVSGASGGILMEQEIRTALDERPAVLEPGELTPRQDLLPAEARQLLTALERHRWNRKEAARSLGISRSTLWRALRRYHFG